MISWRAAPPLILGILAQPLCARTVDETARNAVATAETETATATATATGDSVPIVVAGVSGGVVARDGAQDSPFGSLAITRYQGGSYLRASYTGFRGSLQQTDGSVRSTYQIGSVGAGGTWRGWVADAYVSAGWQDYGTVDAAPRTDSGSFYGAAGLRAGRALRPGTHWYVTPTLGIQYVASHSLRSRFDPVLGGIAGFELPERALTGTAALRVDRTFGANQEHYVGVSLTHSESDNGLTSWVLAPGGNGLLQPRAEKTPDSWDEVAVAGTWQMKQGLWLDGQVQRTNGAVAGDSTTVMLGVRVKM